MVERKIVELLIGGTGVNAIDRRLKASKRRIRALREGALEYGYLEREGRPGPVKPRPHPDPVDGRSLRVSEKTTLLTLRAGWIRERLEAGWHAVTVHEEWPVAGIGRSSFYRYLEQEGLTRLGESYRVVPEIVHRSGEALLFDWGKLREVADLARGRNGRCGCSWACWGFRGS